MSRQRFLMGTAHPSHLVSIAPGLGLLSDSIISSPILFDPERAGSGGGGGGGGSDDVLGDLENTDPELAMVSCRLPI